MCQLCSQQIQAYKEIKNDSIHLHFINTFLVPVEIQMNALDSTKNLIRVHNYALLHPKDTLNEALVIPNNKVKDTSDINIHKFITYKGSFGNPNLLPDDSLYYLPYPKGKAYKIMQSFGGKFSHNLVSSRYAIDFAMPIGDSISAARSGKVFFIKEDSTTHCPTRQCMSEANKIMVMHSDGSFASYTHLDYQGALVEVGDEVRAGEIIGISGMTGFTTKPHLHLVVHIAQNKSIPIYFKGTRKRKLKQGKTYKRIK